MDDQWLRALTFTCRRPGFDFQLQYGGSQLSITLVPGDSMSNLYGLLHTRTAFSYTQAHTHIHKMKQVNGS